MGYGNISPRNCYTGGQSTNCKMNKAVMEYYEKGTPVDLYFYETDQYKQVELELLRRCHTRYNVKIMNIDWNGNGKIDPVDIGISIAAENARETEPDWEEYENVPAACPQERRPFWDRLRAFFDQ